MNRITAFCALIAFAMFPLLSAFAAETPDDQLAAGRVDQLIQTLEPQLRTSPTAQAYNFLCRAYFELGEWDHGIPLCEKAVALDPANGLYHLWLGRIYGEKADRAGFLSAAGLAHKVRHEFERAVQLSPESWEARTDLAEFYLEAPGIVGGGKDKAREQARLLAPLNPEMSHWVLARLAQREKDSPAAEREYRAALDASHASAHAWTSLAGFYRRANRLDEMQQAVRNLESCPVDRPASLVDAAGLLLHTGRDLPLATQLLRRYLASTTVEEAPAFKAYTMLGELFEKQGERSSAAEQYRAALALADNFRPAQEGLSRVTRP